ncbi:hypothetical protein KR009_006915, partial [Drosophila setifemur]
LSHWQAPKMSFRPKTSYDAVDKIWSSEREKSQFGSELSIGELIFQEMQRHPNDIAQISDSEGTILSRKDLLMNAIRIATFMRNLKLTQSDIVGFVGSNTTHITATAYACYFNGIATHSLNPSYLPEICEKLFDITKPRLIFCDGDVYDKVRAATSKIDVTIVTMRNHAKDAISIDEVLLTPAEEGFRPVSPELGSSHPLAILSTSGTTGTPKAVILSNTQNILHGYGNLTTADIQYAPSSLDWGSGLMTAVSSGVYSTKRIVSDKSFDPSDTLRIIEKYQVTWVQHSPGQMATMVVCSDFEKANLESLRYLNYTGGRCSREVQETLNKKLVNGCLHPSYGFSELGSFGCVNWSFDAKPDSVGRLAASYKLKIINDQGDKLGPNETGELCLNTGAHWPGYYGNPEASSQVYIDNWVHSGDLGYVDDDHFVYIVDRKKDMLKYQSNIYYPHELEEIISRMPGVAEVCVFGIWNRTNGDEAAASVVRKPNAQLSEEDVVEFVAQRTIAQFLKLHVGCLIVEDLKRSANGKTNRNANKEHFIQAKGIQ